MSDKNGIRIILLASVHTLSNANYMGRNDQQGIFCTTAYQAVNGTAFQNFFCVVSEADLDRFQDEERHTCRGYHWP